MQLVLDCLQEIAVVHSTIVLPVYVEQVLPYVPPKRSLIVAEHARRLGDQLEVDVVLLNQVFVLDLGLRQATAQMRCLREHSLLSF